MGKIIAVDFDGTLCENHWPEIGSPRQQTIQRLREEVSNGAKIILWTCREGHLLQNAIDWCASIGIRFDAINDNICETVSVFGANPRKISATEYWDDKAVNPDAPSCNRCRSMKPTQGKKQRVAEWCACSCKNYKPK